MLNLKEPVKARVSDNYLAVIEDADGVVHYWLPNGTYDGYDRTCEKAAVEEKTRLVKGGSPL